MTPGTPTLISVEFRVSAVKNRIDEVTLLGELIDRKTEARLRSIVQ